MKKRFGLLITTVMARAISFARQIIAIADATSLPKPNIKIRNWEVPLGPVVGKKGERHTISFEPQCYFRSEKLMATDSFSKPGLGTKIDCIFIGQELQHSLGNGGTLSLFFSNQSFGNELKWDVCHPALSITMTIEFLEDCEFNASLSGKVVLSASDNSVKDVLKALEAV